jgi:hypothetical protein
LLDYLKIKELMLRVGDWYHLVLMLESMSFRNDDERITEISFIRQILSCREEILLSRLEKIDRHSPLPQPTTALTCFNTKMLNLVANSS